jgi:hypothetical protein
MLTLEVDSNKDLDAWSLQKIFEFLKIAAPPDVSSFLAQEDGKRDFHSFFFEVLVEKEIPCVVDVDWKWEPEDLIRQIAPQFPDGDLKFIESSLDENEVYMIVYQLGPTTETLHVGFDEPGTILEVLANGMDDKKFIALDFLEDRYSWLITPKSFYTEAFCVLTGATIAQKEPVSAEDVPEFFTEDHKLPEKIFFSPSIMYVDNGQMGYEMPNQVWSGRVLPGQTVREGIATELMKELGYSGRFDYTYEGYRGAFPDRKGRSIKKYAIDVYLYDKNFQSKMAGEGDIKLRRIINKKFPHPDAASE